MSKQRIEKMNTTEHFRMYKSGKNWLFSGILAFGVGLGLLEGGISARADKLPTVNDQADQTTSTSGKANGSDNTVVLRTDVASMAAASAASEKANAAEPNSDAMKATEGSATVASSSVAKNSETSAASSQDQANAIDVNSTAAQEKCL